MHPEIVRDEPGACPICGMALEPRVVTLEEQNPELDDMTRRFWWSLGADASPILAFMVSEMLPGQPLQHVLPPAAMTWSQFAAGDARRALGRLAVLRARLGVGREPAPEHVHADRPGRGRGLRLQRRGDARARALSRVVPRRTGTRSASTSRRRRSSSCSSCSARCWNCGRAAGPVRRSRRCWVSRRRRRGASTRRAPSKTFRSSTCTSAIACACAPARRSRWTASSSKARRTVDESMVTGEPIPVEKAAASKVTGGTVNGTGTFVMEAQRVGSDTLLAQIVRLVGEAQRSRAPIQRLADTVSGWFVPAVIAGRRRDLRRLGGLGPGAAPGPRARERRRGADHRVPVRARAGHADVHHGRHGPRRRAGRAAPERRGARSAGAGRHARRRQDRHADRRQAGADDGRPPRRRSTSPTLLRLVASLEQRQRASAGRGHRARRAKNAASRPVRSTDFRSVTGKGVVGVVDGRTVAIGNAGAAGRGGRDRWRLDGARRRRCGARARP